MATWPSRRRSSTRPTSPLSPSSRSSGSRYRSSKISPNLIKAVISVEDQRFYEHSGVDAIRVARRGPQEPRDGTTRAKAGSTITQQLARQSFLSRDKTYRRKLKEVDPRRLYRERCTDKKDILELYLNKVYLGDGLYGVEAAARGYFGKIVSDLTVDEAALLAGLIQSPSSYAPTVNLDRAIARRNVVLQTMVVLGRDRSGRRPSGARRRRVQLNNALEIKETFGLYFKEQVRRELVERFGWQRVYQGGLRVFTTHRPDLQQAAETLVEKGLVDIERRPRFQAPAAGRAAARLRQANSAQYLQGALVAMDPATRLRPRAWSAGATSARAASIAPSQAKRQSGSAFKPFVYAAALEAGYSPASLITRSERSDRDATGRLAPRGRALDRRLDDAAHGAADVEQPRGGAAAEHGRHPEGRRLRARSSTSARRRACRRWRSARAT